MSETAPERTAPRGRGGSIFMQRIGPLPMIAWVAIAAIALLGWRWWSSRKTSQQSAQAAQDTASTSASTVPQFVNQTYTTVTSPPSPVTVSVTDDEEARKHPARPHGINPGGPISPAGYPTTVSGYPGSYTTGINPGGLNEWTSTGKYSLNVIAKSHGMTAAQLIQASMNAQNNTGLRAYLAKKNYNLPVPAGIQLFFPAQNWQVLSGGPMKPAAGGLAPMVTSTGPSGAQPGGAMVSNPSGLTGITPGTPMRA